MLKEHGLVVNIVLTITLQVWISYIYLFVTVPYSYKQIMYDLAMKMQ